MSKFHYYIVFLPNPGTNIDAFELSDKAVNMRVNVDTEFYGGRDSVFKLFYIREGMVADGKPLIDPQTGGLAKWMRS